MIDAIEKAAKEAFRSSSAVKIAKSVVAPKWGKVPRAEYTKVYGALTEMKGDNPLERAFANGVGGHSMPLVTRRSTEVLPGVYSFERDYLLFLRKLSGEFNNTFKVSLDKNMFTPTGIHTNFDRLRCPAGYFQNPMSYTAVDNSLYRAELGLAAGYTPRQRAIAIETWKLVASTIAIAPVNVPKLSTGGMRRFTSDPQWKLCYADWLIDAPLFTNFERMLSMVQKKDAMGLANNYEAIFATYIQKRGQVDDPDKVRYVFDIDYALSGGRSGNMFPTDKKVVLDGTAYTDFAAIRARVVHAGPWVINCYLQAMSTTMMKSLFVRYPNTFHINTPSEIKELVDGKHIDCSDVTEYDRSMSRDAIQLAHDVLREYWDERLVDASWKLFTSPYYAKPLDMNGKRGTWVKNPLVWTAEEEVFAGNRSGHAWTSLVAKVNKVIASAFGVDQIYPLLGRMHEFLQGNMPMGLANNGDDEIIWALNIGDIERFKKNRSSHDAEHYLVKSEVGQGYSGQLLVRPNPNETVYFPTARIQTSYEKTLVPERAIGGIHRPNWPIGTMTRIETLTSTDAGRESWSIFMSTYRRDMEDRHGAFLPMLLKAVASLDVDIDRLTEIDRMVIDSPDKIHHAIDPSDVSASVLDRICAKIPVSVVEHFCKRYYKGVIL